MGLRYGAVWAVWGLIAKKVVGEVMIIHKLARYDARPRPPSDTCQESCLGASR